MLVITYLMELGELHVKIAILSVESYNLRSREVNHLHHADIIGRHVFNV